VHFAEGVRRKWEGFVLKPTSAPYFSLDLGSSSHAWIKLKKDYIRAMGDMADFAVVGAGYCSIAANELAQRLGVDPKVLKWTHFHIACLDNSEEVDRFNQMPRFLIIDAINQCITKKDLLLLNQEGQAMCHDIDVDQDFNIFTTRTEGELSCKLSVYFQQPYVFEILGSGFHKGTNRGYHSLRFPRILKIHWGRS
jgi:DNA ligase-4